LGTLRTPVLLTQGRSDTVVLPAMADHILRVCPETLSRIAELSQHEADGCELEEGEGVAG
jgi:hypothetical protein